MLADVPDDARLLGEEIFGPVAPVKGFSSDDEAIAAANDTEYGLVAYVYTQDINRAFKVIEGLDTGMIGLNQGMVSNAGAPFGGVKQSGFGREGGPGGHPGVPGDQVRRDERPVALSGRRQRFQRRVGARWTSTLALAEEVLGLDCRSRGRRARVAGARRPASGRGRPRSPPATPGRPRVRRTSLRSSTLKLASAGRCGSRRSACPPASRSTVARRTTSRRSRSSRAAARATTASRRSCRASSRSWSFCWVSQVSSRPRSSPAARPPR